MKSRFLCCLIIAASVYSSCSKNGESGGGGGGDEPSKKDRIELLDSLKTSLVFSDETSSEVVSFLSSGSWTAALSDDRAADWCSVSPSSGNAGEKESVVVTVLKNEGDEDRTATVVLTCGSSKVLIPVIQKYQNSLTVTQSKFEVNAMQNTISVEVKAGITPSFTIDDACKDWIKSSGTKGTVTSVFQFEISENEGDRREGKILITSGNLSEVVTVYQEGSVPSIIISQSEIPITYEKCEVKVEVRHNVGIEMQITSGDDWLSENTSNKFSSTTYSFIAEQNDTDEPRSATVNFTNTEYGLSETVTITQMKKGSIVIAKTTYNVAQGGETIELVLTRNVAYDVNIDCDWIEEAVKNTFITENLYFTVKANENYEGRSGTITFTSPEDPTIKQDVIVFQSQKDAIVIGGSSTKTSYESTTFTVKVKSNVDVSVSIPSEATWIHKVENNTKGGLVENTFSFLVDENKGGSTRQAELAFANFQSGITQKYLVLQGAKPTVVVGDIYNITYEGGDVEIKIASNLGTYDVEVESAASSWLRYVGRNDLRNDILNFVAAEQDKYETRQATVSIIDAVGTTVKTFIIKQNAKPIPTFEIWYSTKAGYTLENIPKTGWGTGVSLRENVTVDNHCVLRFDGDVISVPSYAFKDQTTLVSMTLPESVTTIGNYAFSGCTSMSDVTIPNNVSSVGTGAFADFAGIAYINSSTLPANAFQGTNIVCASFGEGVTGIAEKAFYNCPKLAYVTLPNTLTSIGDYAFAKCPFTSIVLPTSLRTLGKGVFSDCASLKSASMSDTLTTMGDETFLNCTSLETLFLPSVNILPAKTCNKCSALCNVTMAEGIKSIGQYAFSGCKALTEITLPSSCTSIGNYAFSECIALTAVTCKSKTLVTFDIYSFNNSNELTKLYVPEGSEGIYHNNSWKTPTSSWSRSWNNEVKYINGIYTYFLSSSYSDIKYELSGNGVRLTAFANIYDEESSGLKYPIEESGICFGDNADLTYSQSSAIKTSPIVTVGKYSCKYPDVLFPNEDGIVIMYFRPYVKFHSGGVEVVWQEEEVINACRPMTTGVTLEYNNYSGTVGERIDTLRPTIAPQYDAITGETKWVISDTTVVKYVREETWPGSGWYDTYFQFMKEGEATITYQMEYKGYSSSCKIVVFKEQTGDYEKPGEKDWDF